MIYLTVFLFASSAGLLLVGAAQLLPGRRSEVAQRLVKLDEAIVNPFGTPYRRDRQARREKWEAVFQELGERITSKRPSARGLQQRVVQAGLHNPNAAAVFAGVRLLLPLALAGLGVLLLPSAGSLGLVAIIWLGAMGWIGPSFWLDRRIKARQHAIQRTLADALDLMVTCVEAGLGINQAIMRVADEIRHFAPVLSQELTLLNLEIRAGAPRAEALRNLADRTGVEDLREWTTIMIQTDRFGTSAADALRVHTDVLRTKRRQRAEEASAKAGVKILFPVLTCIFPGLFVVLIGPGGIMIYEVLITGALSK
jgi:tight adherence protein C